MAQQPPQEGPALPRGTYTVTDLEQIRAMADPLRLSILGELAGVPRTTKQVAELLGEKPTRLYHHVEALERVGLVRLTQTRAKRGTVEKYYQAVAAQFRVAASALSPEARAGAGLSEVEKMLTSILDTTRTELLATLRPGAPKPDPAEAPLLARLLVRGSEKKVRAVRRQLLRLMEKLRADDAEGAAPKEVEPTHALVVVLYRQDWA
jgi:DNA-binding transcriptional ArsR family regulator